MAKKHPIHAYWKVFQLASLQVKEARKNLNHILTKMQKSPVGHIAKDLAKTNGTKVLSWLDFPTKKDVTKLHHRLSQLEQRMQDLRKAP